MVEMLFKEFTSGGYLRHYSITEIDKYSYQRYVIGKATVYLRLLYQFFSCEIYRVGENVSVRHRNVEKYRKK